VEVVIVFGARQIVYWLVPEVVAKKERFEMSD
jgi:hypothetical protein